MQNITKKEFDLFTEYIIRRWGINLDESKVYLVESRLKEVVEKFECRNYFELYQKLLGDQAVASAVISAISTNETFFFRDDQIFDLIKGKTIPELLSKSKILNIWSAACSYGQEVYTLAIILSELFIDPKRYRVQITGTDISDRTLAYASHGTYTRAEVNRGLSPSRIQKHFYLVGEKYQVNESLRAWAYFQKLNLMEPLPFNKKFDLVLCRNVSIYFNTETKKKVYERIANCMSPNGILILGSSEMLFGLTDRFERKEHNRLVYHQLKS